MDDDDKFPSQLADRFQVRMPEGMRERIAEAARANNRSMNSEIVARLESTFSGGKVSNGIPFDMVKEYIEIYADAISESRLLGYKEGIGVVPWMSEEETAKYHENRTKKLNARINDLMKKHGVSK